MFGEGLGGRGWCAGVLVCVLLLSVCAGVAFGAGGYEVVGSIGGIEAPESVAVDQASGEVYVLETSSPEERISRFTASGKPDPFSSAEPYLRRNSLFGPVEEFRFGFPHEAEVAVDGSSGPASGDVYATEPGRERVDVFASSGAFLGEVGVGSASPLSGGEPCGVAVDGVGNVFIAWFSGHVDEFTPTTSDPADDSFDGQLENVGEICGVAVETGGKTFVQLLAEARGGQLFSYEPKQYGEETPVPQLAGAAVQAYGINPVNNHLFRVEGGMVSEYDTTGALVGAPFGPIAAPLSLAVNAALERVYVVDASTGRVDIFEVPRSAAPSVEGESSADVGSTFAEIKGELSANLLDTHAYLEYGGSSAYGIMVPAAPGVDIGSGRTVQDVAEFLTGLAPGTTYHYRVVAGNANGVTDGPDRTFTTPTPSSLSLPDGRAWEMVSPLDKNGGEVAPPGEVSAGGVEEASADGEHVTYLTLAAFGEALGSPLGDQYLASRTPAGWSSSDLMTPMNAGSFDLAGEGGPYIAFSTDLRSSLERNGTIAGGTPVLNPPLAPLAPPRYENFYLRDDNSGALQALLTQTPEVPAGSFQLEFEGASPDLKHIVLSSESVLTPGAVAGPPNLYEWSGGVLQAVNVLPGVTDGETAPGAVLGAGPNNNPYPDTSHAVSDDGSRVYFTDDESAPGLYVRENAGAPDARTLLLGGGGVFQAASADGNTAFFTESGDLFEFDAMSGGSRDLTVDASHGGAGVQGVLGASSDGAYVYFVANGRLAAGAEEGNCDSRGNGEVCGLYMYHEGHVAFITMLSQGDAADWALALVDRTARVSGDGRHVVFMSSSSLTGYDNLDANTSVPDSEVYEYGPPVEFGQACPRCLECASCDETGARPTGPSNIPAASPYGLERAVYQSRVVSFDGSRVFFNSSNALVSGDTNGRQDVYEFEGGHDYLISGGTSGENSVFVDASESGNDVFFITGQQLVGQDKDQIADLYDARVGGGFPAPAVPAPACAGDNCLTGLAASPVFGAPVSSTFAGPGNLVPKHTVTAKKTTKHKAKKTTKHKAKKKAKKHKAKKAAARGKGRASRRSVRSMRGRG
jgi:hypothetical protein